MVFWNENCFIREELFIEYLNKWNYEVDFAGDTNFTPGILYLLDE